MNRMTLIFDHLHLSAEISSDKGLLKKIHFDIQKPDETIVIRIHAPIINEVKIELDFVRFQDDVLTLHSLSDRKIADMLINFLERYMQPVSFIKFDHPHISINTKLLGNMYFPKLKIRHIAVANKQYIIETEII
ncbi:MAG: hypothetical protein R6V48_04535 [Fidelibacterota bacterium]